MKGFYQHLLLELRSGWRNRSLLLLYYLFPLGFYMMMGLIMTELIPDFRSFMLPAMVVFTILSASVLGLPNPLVEARESGVLRNYRIHGIPSASVLGAISLTAIMHSVVAAGLIALSAPRLFGAQGPASWGAMLGVTVLTAGAYAGLGALIGVVSANSRTTIMWSQLLYLPSFLLGGVMIPSELLPEGLSRVAVLLPTTHSMLAFRTLAYGETLAYDPTYGLLTLAAGAIAAFLMAHWLFRWDAHHNETLRYPWVALGAFLPYAVWLLA